MQEINAEVIAKAVETYMQTHNISQSQFASIYNINQATVSRIIHSKQKTITKRMRIIHASIMQYYANRNNSDTIYEKITQYYNAGGSQETLSSILDILIQEKAK